MGKGRGRSNMGNFGMGSKSESAPVNKPEHTADPWQNLHARQFLVKSRSERRKGYRCGRNFTTINDIPMFSAYHKRRGRGKSRREDGYAVNMELSSKVSIWQGDITTLEVDAIVNAANSTLLGGGGVDGAIHRAAGSTLLSECRTLNGCRTGQTKLTGGHMLPARYILHTVGPQGQKPQDLENCYGSCLQIARERNLRSIAFCCISTGIYGYPNEPAAHIALDTVRRFLESFGDEIDRIIFCTFLQQDFSIYENLMSKLYFPCCDGQQTSTNSNVNQLNSGKFDFEGFKPPNVTKEEREARTKQIEEMKRNEKDEKLKDDSKETKKIESKDGEKDKSRKDEEKHSDNKSKVPEKLKSNAENHGENADTPAEKGGEKAVIIAKRNDTKAEITAERAGGKEGTTVEKDAGKTDTVADKHDAKGDTAAEKDAGETESTVEKDAGETESTVEKDAGETESTVEKDAGETGSTAEKDAGETGSTAEKDAGETGSTVEKDAGETGSTVEENAGEGVASERIPIETDDGSKKATESTDE